MAAEFHETDLDLQLTWVILEDNSKIIFLSSQPKRML